MTPPGSNNKKDRPSRPVHRNLIVGMYVIGLLGVVGAAIGLYVVLHASRSPVEYRSFYLASSGLRFYLASLGLSLIVLTFATFLWLDYQRYAGKALAAGRVLSEFARFHEGKVNVKLLYVAQYYRAILYGLGAKKVAHQLDQLLEIATKNTTGQIDNEAHT